ncbi:MAG: hypothetical protein JO089_09505, partial [Alphaproteobacteria bacterium]|nr:hypothetical protein [Alphaproteobacteria bacterium]
AAYGHFGRAPEADGAFSWEKLDLVQALQDYFPKSARRPISDIPIEV